LRSESRLPRGRGHSVHLRAPLTQRFRRGRADGGPADIRRDRTQSFEQGSHATFAGQHHPVVLTDPRARAIQIAVALRGPDRDRRDVQQSKSIMRNRVTLGFVNFRARVDDCATSQRYEADQLLGGERQRPRQ